MGSNVRLPLITPNCPCSIIDSLPSNAHALQFSTSCLQRLHLGGILTPRLSASKKSMHFFSPPSLLVQSGLRPFKLSCFFYFSGICGGFDGICVIGGFCGGCGVDDDVCGGWVVLNVVVVVYDGCCLCGGRLEK